MSRASRHLRKINNAMEDRIDPMDFDTMTGIVCYLRSTSLTAMQQEEVRRDIIDMLIDGRRRGQTASDVIGGDYRAFCDEIVAAVAPVSLWRRMLGWIDLALAALASVCWIMLVVGVIDAIKHGMLPNVPVQVGLLVAFAMYAAAAVGTVQALSRHAFDFGFTHGSMNWRKVAIWVAYCLILGVGTTISTVVTASFVIPAVALAIIAVILTALAVLLDYWL